MKIQIKNIVTSNYDVTSMGGIADEFIRGSTRVDFELVFAGETYLRLEGVPRWWDKIDEEGIHRP